MSYLEDEFKSYRTTIIPEDAGYRQIGECRRAFYCGAAAMFQFFMHATAGEEAGHTPHENPVDQMRGELQRYIDELGTPDETERVKNYLHQKSH